VMFGTMTSLWVGFTLETGEVGSSISEKSLLLGSSASGGMGKFLPALFHFLGSETSGLMKHLSSFLLEST
jgi:hypothetical protein